MKHFRPVVSVKRLLYGGLLHRRTVKGAVGFSSGAKASSPEVPDRAGHTSAGPAQSLQ